MSFKSVLQGIGVVAKEAQVLSPLVSAVYPPAGAVVSTVSSLVIAAESRFPDAPAAGPNKKQDVMAELSAVLPLLQAGLSVAGIKFAVTPELDATISKTVDDVVAVLNDMAKLKTLIEGAAK